MCAVCKQNKIKNIVESVLERLTDACLNQVKCTKNIKTKNKTFTCKCMSIKQQYNNEEIKATTQSKIIKKYILIII